VGIGRAAQIDGMKVHQIFRPRLHAKFLAWDADSVVITSQNWMSADPPDDDS
jgi:cardiolipin synthase